ncbi:hypothetical protein TcWFU_007620 [Taenia crassiceps]|uniref:Uncharacterized protein n=1 Tax=Taenia crassiceps TaxID=6207 RepID=A0ABR4QI92_9CEST
MRRHLNGTMGRGKEFLGACFRTHALLCKALSVILIVISIASSIAGIVLIVKYPSTTLDFGDEFDDWSEQNQKRAIGISLLVGGLFVLFCSAVPACCAFQLGLARRFVESRNDAEQQQIIVEQPPPQQPPPYPLQGYPPQAYPAPPPPPASYGASNVPHTMPPPIPPSYEQAFHMASAPPEKQ